MQIVPVQHDYSLNSWAIYLQFYSIVMEYSVRFRLKAATKKNTRAHTKKEGE